MSRTDVAALTAAATSTRRQDFKDMGLRTRLLMQLAQQLMALAEKHQVAVVYTNQVTTKLLANDLSKLVPALGEPRPARSPRCCWGARCARELGGHVCAAERGPRGPAAPRARASSWVRARRCCRRRR